MRLKGEELKVLLIEALLQLNKLKNILGQRKRPVTRPKKARLLYLLNFYESKENEWHNDKDEYRKMIL